MFRMHDVYTPPHHESLDGEWFTRCRLDSRFSSSQAAACEAQAAVFSAQRLCRRSSS